MRSHSLLDQYPKIPPGAKVVAIDIDDPYGVPSDAVSKRVAAPAGSTKQNGPANWQAPEQPLIRVIASVRSDVAAVMFARNQIDKACFRAARGYQELYEVTHSSRLKSCDLDAVHSGAVSGSSYGVDLKRRARVALMKAENQIAQKFGAEGVHVLRDVLALGKTLERAAAERGELTKNNIGWLGGFFRRVLKALAVVLGYATAGAYK